MTTHITNGARDSREKITEVAEYLADIVGSTLGPKGQNVLISPNNKPVIITRDGVTVAEYTELNDHTKNAILRILKQAAYRTNEECGDGTTTSTILSAAILRAAQSYLVSGVFPADLFGGMTQAIETTLEMISESSIPIRCKDDIRHIATISANGDTAIGELIATAIDTMGKDGAITIQNSRSMDTTLTMIEGFRFDSGFVSTAFITHEKENMVRYEDPQIFITDEKLTRIQDMFQTLEYAARQNKPLIIIAEEVSEQALAALVANAQKGTLRVAAVKAPRYGEERRRILEDLAIATGATLVGASSGIALNEVKLEHLGTANRVEILKGWTTIIGGKGDQTSLDARVEKIKQEIKDTENLTECERLQERITRLSSGVGVIGIGGATEAEVTEKRYRIDDALGAVRAAQQEGILPGGGTVLLRAARKIEKQATGQTGAFSFGQVIIGQALKESMRRIITNAGKSFEVAENNLTDEQLDQNMGYDLSAENELIPCELISKGIIDPAKVVRCALQNAFSVAMLLLTTSNLIVQE